MSEMSNLALIHAVKFAEAYKAEIILLTIVEPVRMPALGFVSGSETSEMRKNFQKSTVAAKKEASNMLEKKRKELSRKGIKVAKILLVDDDPVSRIVKVVKSRRADLVIIASRRLKGLAKLKALGSISRKVSEQVRCSVLIVR